MGALSERGEACRGGMGASRKKVEIMPYMSFLSCGLAEVGSSSEPSARDACIFCNQE